MLRQTTVRIKWFIPTYNWIIIALLLFFSQEILATHSWRKLAPGIEYQDLDGSFLTPWSHIHAFRINLKNNRFLLATAHDLSHENASVDEYAQHAKALLAINGGFFDHNYQSLGLRIHNKHRINPLKNISWWGIFYIKNQKPSITNISHFKPSKHIDFAIQSGPRLLINNRIPPLRPGRAQRSALCITPDEQVIMVVTENMPISTTELAQVMKAPPLHCENALNLDGGSSSQLHANIGSFQLKVHGFSNVSDAILIKKRNKN